jgi:EAL domain-containing protein (putative c-di-GMP-specific phosphodiesterase class I)
LQIESRLRQGLAQGEFVLFYQPVLDTETAALVGAEALLRWPAMNAAPDLFIPVAEKAGVMPALGEWVMREACRQQREWQDKGLPAFPVAVNVSPVQFRQQHFANSVGDALAQARLGPGSLHMEVTEGTVMRNVEDAADVLAALQAIGVKVALDDFGTGYSSLSYLSRLPIDILKLDQSFLQDIGRNGANAAVVEGIIALGRSLGLEVIAEGVESEESLAFLRAQHCTRGQGFHFSRPMPAPQFEQWCAGR